MINPNNPCLFCRVKKSEFLDENKFAYATFDSYPVSKQHCLIVPKRHVKDYFKLTEKEIIGCNKLIKNLKKKLKKMIAQ